MQYFVYRRTRSENVRIFLASAIGIFLQLEEIEHGSTKVNPSKSKGTMEGLQRTLIDERFRVDGRRNWFETSDKMPDVEDGPSFAVIRAIDVFAMLDRPKKHSR